jgi:hypothetical protein
LSAPISLISALISLAVSSLSFINKKESRKYVDKLLDFQEELLNMDMLPNDQVDDVRYVKVLQEIKLITDAAKNDPEIFKINPPSESS